MDEAILIVCDLIGLWVSPLVGLCNSAVFCYNLWILTTSPSVYHISLDIS